MNVHTKTTIDIKDISQLSKADGNTYNDRAHGVLYPDVLLLHSKTSRLDTDSGLHKCFCVEWRLPVICRHHDETFTVKK